MKVKAVEGNPGNVSFQVIHLSKMNSQNAAWTQPLSSWLSISNPEGCELGIRFWNTVGSSPFCCLLLCEGLPSSFGQLYLSAAQAQDPKEPLVVIVVGNGAAKDELLAF